MENIVNNEETYLYHCTNENGLISILNSKHFRYSYCLEEYDGLKDGFGKELIAYAMVCFADLNKNELPRHMKQFNSVAYLIMDREWAKAKNISPVIYYHKNGLSNIAFNSLAKIVVKLCEHNMGNKEELLLKTIELFRPFLKKYEGHYYNKLTGEKSFETVKFFLEREWRSFPIVQNYERYFLSKNDYLNQELKSKEIERLENNGIVLEFEWDNIIKIGCHKNPATKVLEIITKTYGIKSEDAFRKIEIIDSVN